MLRPCLGLPHHPCGKLSSNSRCADCARIRERARPQRPTNLTRTSGEQARRKATVDAWIATHGYVCPGFQREAHGVQHPNILTADHITAIATGGRAGGPLQVLCRVCNGRKAARGNDH